MAASRVASGVLRLRPTRTSPPMMTHEMPGISPRAMADRASRATRRSATFRGWVSFEAIRVDLSGQTAGTTVVSGFHLPVVTPAAGAHQPQPLVTVPLAPLTGWPYPSQGGGGVTYRHLPATRAERSSPSRSRSDFSRGVALSGVPAALG